MDGTPGAPAVNDERYSRQQLVPGWDQARLLGARLLVVGAGALGNEILKNLALVGVGSLDIADFDVVEPSNLSRCVLFHAGDVGRAKAVVAAERLCALNPQVHCRALNLDVECELGAGALREYDLVVGAVDSIAARLALNRLCRRAGVPLLDGGMDAAGGQASFFHPVHGACYECSMTEGMWARMGVRQGCLRQGSGEDAPAPRLAATVLLASMTGGLVAQEAVRLLLREGTPPLEPGGRACLGTAPYQAVVLQGHVRADCAAHATDRLQRLALEIDVMATSCCALLEQAQADVLHLDWDVVTALECFGCSREEVVLPLFALRAPQLACARCGRVRVPAMQSSIHRQEPLAQAVLADLGVPALAVLQASRGEEHLLLELVAPSLDAAGTSPLQEARA